MTARWSAAAAAAAAYAAVTACFAFDLLRNPGSTIAGDPGDPLFVAGILHWNATTVPLTDAWWQLPIFHPTRDAIAFSEHFLGLSPIATPIHWLARDPLVTYNVVTLLTFPLCGLAMFALAYRLTRSAPAAFLAGLAFAFAPYRISHLPHLQMLAFFWAPLALAGLHAYLDSGRWRWLALYGAAWMLQGASNGYALVFLSLLVAFWVLWFVVARRNWAALGAIAVATLAAALPLLPIVMKYLNVHALHGFERGVGEMRTYSADLTAVLCAPASLTFWGWLRVGCRPEGELFPGIAVIAASLFAFVRLAWHPSARTGPRRPLTLVSRALIAVGLVAAAAALSVTIAGPWAVQVAQLRISASSVPKPTMLATVTVLLGLVLSPGIRAAAGRSSTTGFYLVAALLTWALALGPTLTFMGEPRGFQAPFALLTALPGVSGLRVPARFWLLTTLCLAALVGIGAARVFERRGRAASRAAMVLASAVLLMDGWIARIPAAPVQDDVPGASGLRNANVLHLPIDSMPDIAAGFRAMTGGWRTVNGYSGYFPAYYVALSEGMRDQDDRALAPFLARGDLHVVVTADAAALRSMIERQPGAVLTQTGPNALQYRVPRRNELPPVDVNGERLPISDLRASCGTWNVQNARDADERTRWECGLRQRDQQLLIDIGQAAQPAAIFQSFARYYAGYPRHLRVETSLDGVSWETAWDGSVRGLLIDQAIDRPGPSLRVTVPLPPRQARYIRLREMAPAADAFWSVAEIEVTKGSSVRRFGGS